MLKFKHKFKYKKVMKQKGFINVLLIVFAVVFICAIVYFALNQQTIISPTPKPAEEINSFEKCVQAGYPVAESYPRQCRTSDGKSFVEELTGGTGRACTQEAKQCPDGSYVSRTGPNCEFAECPSLNPLPITECKKDSDCPSSQYSCETIQGAGTVCPSNDPSCVPASTVVEGVCKLKEGSKCNTDSDCVAGNLCHKNICISPVGRQCNGPIDTSCPSDYECVQGCGSPVPRPNEPEPAYFCQLKGYYRPCPICLAANTLIDTSSGAIPVQQLREGTQVWTVDKFNNRVVGVVQKTSKVQVPLTHKMVRLILNNGRELFVSPGHPTIDGRTVGDLNQGDLYDGSSVTSNERVSYSDGATYDILPSGDTGFYWANGILVGSTLR